MVPTATTPSRWPAGSLLAGVGMVGALVVFALVRYPANLHAPGAAIYLSAFCVMFALYLGLGGWAVHRPQAGAALGTLMGLAAGAFWSGEIWVGGPARLDAALERSLGGTFALVAAAVTVLAGVLSGLRWRDPGVAMRTGLFAGLVSGVAVFCFAVVMTLTNLGVLSSRYDYQQQFAAGASHAPDMATFLVGDILAAGIAHLVINLILGLIGGGLGAAAATGLGRPRAAVVADGPPAG